METFNEKNTDDKMSAEMQKKGVRTKRVIIIIMVTFVAVPLLLAWLSGAIRF
jgi:hypothetical protein